MAADPYVVLGVSRSATVDEIRRAYRRHALRLHPDRHPGDKEAERKFKEISAAYGVLSDQSKRAAYDRGDSPGGAPRPQVVVPPFQGAYGTARGPRGSRRRAPPGPTFSTGPMELGKTYMVRPGSVRLGPVPFHGASGQGEMPAFYVFPGRKRK